MSVAIPYTDWAYFPPYLNPGVSDASKKIETLVSEALKNVKDTAANERRLDETISTLEEIFEECNEPNWDGYGAKPIASAAYNEALKLLDKVAPSVPMPEIVPEPSGGIGLEWRTARRSIFTISLSGSNIIHYAGLFGIDKLYGTVHFTDSFPSIISENIQRLYL